MQSLLIQGGRPLAGQIGISGSKNAALPMLAATVLFQKPCVLRNVPKLTDVALGVEMLRHLGAWVEWKGSTLVVDPRPIWRWDLPEKWVKSMRGSVFFAGPLLARFGRCVLTQPGGCPLGKRPVDFHAMSFRALGARETEKHPGHFFGPLTGGRIVLPYPSVGATENGILAALGAEGETILENAAREPEIVCLCDFLRSGGGVLSGDGTNRIVIRGGRPQMGDWTVIPDRMEAATFACACASAGGEITLQGAWHHHLTPVLDALEGAGCHITRETESITLKAQGLHSPGRIETGPYPGFPTDAQAVFLAAMLRAEGQTQIRETVFAQRMGHVPALREMGGNIVLAGDTAIVTGGPTEGKNVTAPDLRGGAALAVAALAARGTTTLRGMEHIHRGYEHFGEKLRWLGADVTLA